MADKTTSQAQQKNAAPESAPSIFEKMAEDHAARIEAFFGEIQKVEERSVQQTNEAIEETAKLMKESIGYATRLGAEWRRLALASSRQAAQMMSAARGV